MKRNELRSKNSLLLLSKIDPRLSLLYTVLFSIVVALSNKIPGVVFSLLSSFLFLILSRLNLFSVIRRLIFVIIFLIFLWFILPFSILGKTIFSIWKLHALSHLYIPNKIIYLFFILYRYIGVIWDEYLDLIRVLKVRGFKPSFSLHSYKTYAYVMGALFIKSYNRAENVHKAMLCRGFNGKYWVLNNFKFGYRDLIIGLSMLINLLFIVFLQWTGITL